MKTTGQAYDKMTKAASPPSKKGANFLKAFGVGGLICMIGEILWRLFQKAGLPEEQVRVLVSATLIVATAVLTGFGIFDKIAKQAGAGTIVPITGFANSVVSPAMEFQSEGRILGTGANMFKIAGPVIVYGTAVCVVYGFLYYMMH